MSVPAGLEVPSLLPSFKRVLLATDFSPQSEAAAPFAALIADYYDSTIWVTHVVSPEPEAGPGTESPSQANSADAEQQMQHFLAGNRLGDARREIIIIEQGRTGDVLARLVEEKGIDLIVLGTHGRQAWAS